MVGITVCLVILFLEVIILSLRRIINSAVYPVGYRQKYLLKHFLYGLLRYILDVCCKLALLGLALTNSFTIYINYNWFKGAINQRCADGNYGTLYGILNPFVLLYTDLYNYAIAVLVICVFMLIIDVIHFIYIWRNELSYYLVDTGEKQMVKR